MNYCEGEYGWKESCIDLLITAVELSIVAAGGTISLKSWVWGRIVRGLQLSRKLMPNIARP